MTKRSSKPKLPSSADLKAYEDSRNQWPTKQEYYDTWRRRLLEIIGLYENEPANTVKGKLAIDAKYALSQLDIVEGTSHEILGFEALVRLIETFCTMQFRPHEPWVGKSRKGHEAAVLRGQATDRLKDNWPAVRDFIIQRPKGVSEIERCRQARMHLLRRTFPGLETLEPIEITADALQERMKKHRAALRKR